MSRPALIGALLGLGAAGVAAGIAGSFVAIEPVTVAPLGAPIGFLVATAATVGLFAGARALMRTRAGAVAAAVGWLVAVLPLSMNRAEGDVVLPASRWQAWLYLIVATIAA